MKLSYNKIVGRFKNIETGKSVNIHKGRWMTRGVDIRYYIRSGTRVIVSDRDLSEKWVQINEINI
jgi:hypothetical protein